MKNLSMKRILIGITVLLLLVGWTLLFNYYRNELVVLMIVNILFPISTSFLFAEYFILNKHKWMPFISIFIFIIFFLIETSIPQSISVRDMHTGIEQVAK